jgi:hypothetical protein
MTAAGLSVYRMDEWSEAVILTNGRPLLVGLTKEQFLRAMMSDVRGSARIRLSSGGMKGPCSSPTRSRSKLNDYRNPARSPETIDLYRKCSGGESAIMRGGCVRNISDRAV